MDARDFYDDLVDLYDLIYVDWDAARRRHAQAILSASGDVAARRERPLRVLDVSAGIGTQSLPLAAAGLEVTARDLSPASVARLDREARSRGLAIDTGVGDMRALDVGGPFDVVLSFDNSVPHLMDDDAILEAFREARRVLANDGRYLISVRDYGEVDRSPRSVHRYGERHREGRTFDVRQEWEWIDADHYRTTMVLDEVLESGPVERLRTPATYYAVEIDRLLALLSEAGFEANVAEDVDFYQPILVGRKAGADARRGGGEGEG